MTSKRFQFRLRSMIWVILLVSIVLGIWQYQVRFERWQIKVRSQAVELLLKAPDEFGNAEWPKNSDPVSIVRAVNFLHDLGHDQTILALREFFTRHPDRAGPVLHVLIPLLYENGESFLHGGPSMYVVEDDLPIHFFMNVQVSPSSFPAKSLDQLEQQGVIRGDRMIPPDDPFAAAGEIVQRQADESLRRDYSYKSSIHEWVQMQLYESTSHLSPIFALDPRSTGKWEAFKTDLQSREIYWDAELQAYATKIPPQN